MAQEKKIDPLWVFPWHTLFILQSIWLDLEIASGLEYTEVADLIVPIYFPGFIKEKCKGMSPEYASKPWGYRELLFTLPCQQQKYTLSFSLPHPICFNTQYLHLLGRHSVAHLVL